MRFLLFGPVIFWIACGSNHSSPPPDATGVSACESVIDQVKTACAAQDPTSDRLCIYDALRPLCGTGRTPFVDTLFQCLLLDACQSPSDPSDATNCVRALIESSATSDDKQLGAFACGCETTPEAGCSANLPYSSLAMTMMLTTSDVNGLSTCATAGGCQAQCAQQSALGPALACP